MRTPNVFLYYLFQFLPFVLVGVPLLLWAVLRIRTRRTWDRILTPLSVAALVLTALMMTRAMLQSRCAYGWAAPRPAPILSWVNGAKLYYPPGQGPVLVRLYG